MIWFVIPRSSCRRALIVYCGLFAAAILSGCGSTSTGIAPQASTQNSTEVNQGTGTNGTAPSLTSMAVSPADPSIAKGTTRQFTATGSYSDGTTRNLTDKATWSSSNPGIAVVNSSGSASGVGVGSTTIQAASGSVTGSTSLTVTAAVLSSITVTPANPSISDGTTEQFTATGTYTDGSTQNLTNSVTWRSSNTTVDSINASGLATANGVGTSTIQATSSAVNGSTTLTVMPPTVSVTPSTANVQAGAGMQNFIATVVNDAQNNGVIWSLSGAGCSGAGCGTLSATSSASGAAITYMAPVAAPTPPMIILTATSVSDGTRSNVATISIISSGIPTGSTFTESFGNASNLCWSGGPSSCDQMWVAQGSAQSIAATPGSPSVNMAGPHSLQMIEPAGSASYIYTTGTFPRIPSGTPFDLYFTLDVTSQAMQAFDLTRLITPSTSADGSNYPAQISLGYDGSNLQLQAGGSSFTSNVNLSMNAWHSVQLHMAAGTNASFMVVDGGASNNFTENASDFAYLVLGTAAGQPDALTYYIGNLYVNSALGGGSPPSAYIDFENSTDGTTIDTGILTASTHCGNGIWSLSTDPLIGMTISSAGQQHLPSPVTTCGTQYSDAAGTRGLQYDMSQTARRATYTWSSTSNSVSVGFFFEITVGDTNFYTVFNIDGGPDYAALNVHNGAMALETKSGSSTAISISPNVWYWITIQYNAGGTHQMQVYDPTNWTLLGSGSGAATGNYQPTEIEIGRNGSEPGFPSAYWYYDNIVIDYLTAKFPIVPGAY
jgi:Bacterial Ig-like domain (group 2)